MVRSERVYKPEELQKNQELVIGENSEKPNLNRKKKVKDVEAEEQQKFHS